MAGVGTCDFACCKLQGIGVVAKVRFSGSAMHAKSFLCVHVCIVCARVATTSMHPNICSGRDRERSSGQPRRRNVLRRPYLKALQRWQIGDLPWRRKQRASLRRRQRNAVGVTPAAGASTQRAPTSSPRSSSMPTARRLQARLPLLHMLSI